MQISLIKSSFTNPAFINYNMYTPYFKSSKQTTDIFELSESGRKMKELELTSEVKKALLKNNKQTIDYLTNFADMAPLILRSYPENDIINAVQTFIDNTIEEQDEEKFNLLLIIIHKSLYPHTGVASYVDGSALTERLASIKDINELADDIISEFEN